MSSNGDAITLNEITVHVIKPQERQQILDFLHVHYYREEPLTAGGEPPQPDKEDEDFNLSNIKYGTCLKAVLNTDGQQKIVGALLAGPKGDDEADHIFEEAERLGPTKWGRILHFLGGVERDANIYTRFDVKNVLHVHVMGVNSEMRGKNIGFRLLEHLKVTAKCLNYDMLSADCTSFYSARLFERFGFECINKKYYRDYVDENGKQVFCPQPPHECVQTFALRID